jgi:hypothetical protein
MIHVDMGSIGFMHKGHQLRQHELQAKKTDLVEVIGKLDSIIDLELLNCTRLGIELLHGLLSLYKKRLEAPLVYTTIIINPIQRLTLT